MKRQCFIVADVRAVARVGVRVDACVAASVDAHARYGAMRRSQRAMLSGAAVLLDVPCHGEHAEACRALVQEGEGRLVATPCRSGDVHVHPGHPVGHELLQEERGGDGASFPRGREVGDVSDVALVARDHAVIRRHRMHSLPRLERRGQNTGSQLLVVREERRRVGVGDELSAGQSREVEDGVHAHFHRVGHGIGEDEPTLGVRVRDLDGHAAHRRVDIARAHRARTDAILDERHDEVDVAREADHASEPTHEREDAGGSHVELHVPHGVPGLEVEATAVEDDPLAEEGDGSLPVRSIGPAAEVEQAGAERIRNLVVRQVAATDGEYELHAELAKLRFSLHIEIHELALFDRQALGGLLELLTDEQLEHHRSLEVRRQIYPPAGTSHRVCALDGLLDDGGRGIGGMRSTLLSVERVAPVVVVEGELDELELPGLHVLGLERVRRQGQVPPEREVLEHGERALTIRGVHDDLQTRRARLERTAHAERADVHVLSRAVAVLAPLAEAQQTDGHVRIYHVDTTVLAREVLGSCLVEQLRKVDPDAVELAVVHRHDAELCRLRVRPTDGGEPKRSPPHIGFHGTNLLLPSPTAQLYGVHAM